MKPACCRRPTWSTAHRLASLSARCSAAQGALWLLFSGLPVERWQADTVLGATVAGALLGAWVSSMVGSGIPNSRLRHFEAQIDAGRILLMVDVPERNVERIQALLGERHPEAQDYGLEPRIPVFP